MKPDARLLRFARKQRVTLAVNGEHNQAQTYALKLFRQNAIYTFIPKNACTTMRLSLAVANGCLAGPADVNWIHANNVTFKATLQDLAVASYTFVILRDPFARLASCFLDKIVSKDAPAWAFRDATGRSADLDALTFTEFVDHLGTGSLLGKDEHWRPQIQFCVYERYDDHFAFEDFGNAKGVIEAKTGMEIFDARPLTLHGTDRFENLSESDDHSAASVWDIGGLMRTGLCPHPKSLFSEETAEKAAKLYAADLALYRERTGLRPMFDVT